MEENKLKVVESPILYPDTIVVGKADKVLDTSKNLGWLLSHFEAEIRYNLMTRRREVTIPGLYIFKEDMDNDILARIEDIATLNFFPTKKIDQHLNVLGGENTYHPIVTAIAVNPWDGMPRLDNFIDCLVTENPILTRYIVRTWMVAAIAAAHSQDGFINQGVLVLQGPQRIGKTTWVKALDPINCRAVKESAFLDPSSKDSVAQLSMFWIAELGELESIFRKSDIGRLKSFITTEFDHVRLPYAKKPTFLPRRSAYVATVNDQNFLADNTGNRRWWTIPLSEIKPFPHEQMIQVWAEVRHIWDNGHLTYLSDEIQNQANELNKSHERIDPFEEKLFTWYDWKSPARKEMCASDVLEELGYKNPNQGDCTRMGTLLTKINCKKSRRSNGVSLHEVPCSILHRTKY